MGFPIGTNGGEFTLEFRVKFPGPTNEEMAPTELSGAIMTLSNSTTQAFNLAVWYEKPATTSTTGNLYLTSSAGRLTMASASIFDDNFYNIAVVKERVTGSITLYAIRYENDELVFTSSSIAASGAVPYPLDGTYTTIDLGSSVQMGVSSRGQFWGQEFRAWDAPLSIDEMNAHAAHFESYGRETSHKNHELKLHWRLNDGSTAGSDGKIHVVDSSQNTLIGTGSDFIANENPFTKFLCDYAYIPSYDYGWNQKKVRTYDDYEIVPEERYDDEKFVSLELNMIDALNEDISHLMSSYDELSNFVGLPMNRYRGEYEGLQQMRETYFKRLQGRLNFRVFADMLDFFDRSFVKLIGQLLPARAQFKGDEFIVESHMLERPKYQYNLRPVVEGIVHLSGTIKMFERY